MAKLDRQSSRNLQRKGGFKGFNQKSVSAIFQATDPRKQRAVDRSA